MTPPASERGRIAAIDWIKAIAILAVVLTHAGPNPWQPHFQFADWAVRYSLGVFHVPAFLVVAGFLYQRPHAVGWHEIGSRLQRTWIPFAVASAIAWLVGLWRPSGLADALGALITAQTVGTYTFIAFLGLCTLLLWPISRLAPRTLLALVPALAAASAATEAYAHLHRAEPVVAGIRGDSLALFCEYVLYPVVYFSVGWLASAHRVRLLRWLDRFELGVLALSLAIAALWLAATPYQVTFARAPSAARVVYSLAAVAGLVVVTRRAPAPAPIRFLSDTSLGIFLYHIMLELNIHEHVFAWPPALRIPVCFAASLAFGVYVCVLARRLIGARARLFFGA